jgi:hypothetical protein
MRGLFSLMLVLLLVAGNLNLSAKDDKKKSASELAAIEGGVTYALPRTVIRIEVDAEQEVLVHGPYFAFAQKYLGINNAPKADGENWVLTGVRMDAYGEPDPSAVYRAIGSTAALLSLTEDGVIAGINSDEKQEASKILTSIFPFKSSENATLWTDLSMHSFLTEKDSTKKAGNNFKSLEEKAAEAASDIVKYRKRKASIMAGKDDKFLPDGDAYQVTGVELEKIINSYVELFAGKRVVKQHHLSFEVTPDNKNGKALVAFRFSPNAGVLPASNVSGKPIMLELEPNSELKQKIEAVQTTETTTKGVYYRIPVVTQARLLNGSDVLAQAKLSIAQFGVVTPMSDGLLNGEYSIDFYPATGAIRRIGTK